MVTMEELLASQSKKLITLHRGQSIDGSVVLITDKDVILDLGAKSEGILPKRELPTSQQRDLKIAERIKVYVVMPENESGQAVLSTSAQTRSITSSSFKGRGIHWAKFIQAQRQKSKLAGKVLEINKGGLIVEASDARGFLPNSQVGFELLSKSGEGMENLIGQDLTVTVIEIDQDNNKLIFSQRGQISDELKNKLKSFKNDQKTMGKIVAILPFGLVIDINGVEGLVFISDVSWERQDDLSQLFKVGSEIEVLVTGLDEELGRLNLSIKQLSEDPFLKLVDKYPVDELVKGEVSEVSDAGVVVALAAGIEGLLPASKMKSDTTYEVGKSMSFLVDSVDIQRRKINLAPFITSTEGLIYK